MTISSRTRAKSRFERNHRVADHLRAGRDQFQKNAPDHVADVGIWAPATPNQALAIQPE